MKKIILLVVLANTFCTYSQTLEPTETQALANVIASNNLKSPLENETVTFISTKNKKVFSGITKVNGKFQVLLPKGDKYKVMYKAFTEDKEYSTVEIPNEAGLFNVTVKLTITPSQHYTLDNVFFDTGKSNLKPESFVELNALCKYMEMKKTMVIEISGHTDNVGNSEANQKLSEDRANAVKNYLVKKGVAPERVVAKGYGDTQPIADNNNDEGKRKNRRTEVKTLKQ